MIQLSECWFDVYTFKHFTLIRLKYKNTTEIWYISWRSHAFFLFQFSNPLFFVFVVTFFSKVCQIHQTPRVRDKAFFFTLNVFISHFTNTEIPVRNVMNSLVVFQFIEVFKMFYMQMIACIWNFKHEKKTNFPKFTSHLIHVLTPVETIKIFFLTFGSEEIHYIKTWFLVFGEWIE